MSDQSSSSAVGPQKGVVLAIGLALAIGVLVVIGVAWVNYDTIHDWVYPPEGHAYEAGYGMATSQWAKYTTGEALTGIDLDPELSPLLSSLRESAGLLDATPCVALTNARADQDPGAFDAALDRIDQWVVGQERDIRLHRGGWSSAEAGYYRDGFWDGVVESCPNVFVASDSLFSERPFPRTHPRP